jgi:hypothetical protein
MYRRMSWRCLILRPSGEQGGNKASTEVGLRLRLALFEPIPHPNAQRALLLVRLWRLATIRRLDLPRRRVALCRQLHAEGEGPWEGAEGCRSVIRTPGKGSVFIPEGAGLVKAQPRQVFDLWGREILSSVAAHARDHAGERQDGAPAASARTNGLYAVTWSRNIKRRGEGRFSRNLPARRSGVTLIIQDHRCYGRSGSTAIHPCAAAWRHGVLRRQPRRAQSTGRPRRDAGGQKTERARVVTASEPQEASLSRGRQRISPSLRP